MRRLILALLLSLGPLLIAAPADSHAELVGSNPANGIELEIAPTRVSVWFLSDIKEASIVLKDGAGDDVALAKPKVQGSVVRAEILDDVANDDYEASYRVVAADGHPTTGTISFSVNVKPKPDKGGVSIPMMVAVVLGSAGVGAVVSSLLKRRAD